MHQETMFLVTITAFDELTTGTKKKSREPYTQTHTGGFSKLETLRFGIPHWGKKPFGSISI